MIKGPRIAQDVILEESGTLLGFRNAPVGQIEVESNFRIGDIPREIGRQQFRGENQVIEINRRSPGFWREDRHPSCFLAFLVLMIIFVTIVGESRTGRIAIDLTFARYSLMFPRNLRGTSIDPPSELPDRPYQWM